MSAYYNENDPFAAAWLRRLILFGHIADGVVDERPIQDVRSIDLDGFRQCHFFAGVGVWSHALRRAGWEDDRPVWTGSCPCQPFSLAGSGGGFDDPRHLWPHWFYLIGQRRPVAVFGEQVASAGAWLDLVHDDMEGIDYAVGAVDVPAAGFGGAHIRQRFYWVGDANGAGSPARRLASETMGHGRATITDGGVGGMVDATSEQAGLPGCARESRGAVEWLGDASTEGFPFGPLCPDERGAVRIKGPAFGSTGALRGCDWLFCQDGKLRPVGPGAFPLAHAAPVRVGRLRGYGNALDAETAAQFIAAYMEI